MASPVLLTEWAKKLKKMKIDAPRAVDSYVKDYALVANYFLVVSTPIFSGRAKANWQVGIGSLPTNYRLARPKHPKFMQHLDEVSKQLSSNEVKIRAYSGEGSLYITNNAPYIARLNYKGWSEQTPVDNFIHTAVMAAKDAIRGRKAGTSSFIGAIEPSRVGTGVIQAIRFEGLGPSLAQIRASRRRYSRSR